MTQAGSAGTTPGEQQFQSDPPVATRFGGTFRGADHTRSADNHRPAVLPQYNWLPLYRPHRRRPIRDALVAAHYRAAQCLGRFVSVQTLRFHIVNSEAIRREGPYVLAVTHNSHLEPFLIGLLLKRRIDYIARLEFYRSRLIRFFLNAFDCIPVHRFGVPVSTIRTALDRLKAGHIVGIFPEGGVATGGDFVGRGGAIRRGACVISRRANVPIVPVLLLGSHRLNEARPWVPIRTFPPRRTPLWIAFGNAIEPVADPSPRRARELQAIELQAEFERLYQDLLHRYHLNDHDIP